MRWWALSSCLCCSVLDRIPLKTSVKPCTEKKGSNTAPHHAASPPFLFLEQWQSTLLSELLVVWHKTKSLIKTCWSWQISPLLLLSPWTHNYITNYSKRFFFKFLHWEENRELQFCFTLMISNATWLYSEFRKVTFPPSSPVSVRSVVHHTTSSHLMKCEAKTSTEKWTCSFSKAAKKLHTYH